MKPMHFPFQYAMTNLITKKIAWVCPSDYELWLKDRRAFFESSPRIIEEIGFLDSDGGRDLDPSEYVMHRLVDTHVEPSRCAECDVELNARNSVGYCPKHRHLSDTVRIQRRENQRIRVGTKKYYKKSEVV